jgi:small redox-active disulfide protein 2
VKIEILGLGCAKCKLLTAEAEKAVRATGADATLAKIEDMDAIVDAGVMVTPALAIDGEVKCSGRIAPAREIEGWIRAAQAATRS